MRGTSGRQRVPVSVFDDYEVGVPPLPEQHKIAAILTSVDDAIEKTQAVIDQMQVVKRGLMQELLTHSLPGSRGMTPKGWRAVRFGDVVLLEYGKSLPASHRSGGSVTVCGSSGVVGYHDTPLVAGPGIVIGRKGSVGAVTWIAGDFWPIDTTYYLRPREETDFRWLYYAVSHLRLERLNEATGIPGLNRNTAAALKFVLPPLHEQRKIAAILTAVDDAIEKSQAVKSGLQSVKMALSSVLLTGELRVTPDPEAA